MFFATPYGTPSLLADQWSKGLKKCSPVFCETSHSVGVSSGTDALRFARELGSRSWAWRCRGYRAPHTFIATTEAISQTGALPEFVDIDEQTYNMDPGKLAEYLDQMCRVDDARRLVSRRSGCW